jgi:hypothetical protein
MSDTRNMPFDNPTPCARRYPSTSLPGREESMFLPISHFLLALALSLGLYPSATEAQADSDASRLGLTVQTQQGPVVGTQVHPSVRRFLGIPFAVAPRWEAPQPPPRRNSTFVASGYGPSCPQALLPSILAFIKTVPYDFGVGQGRKESEDCLSVNIWTPSVRRKQKTAVMIWVYGGGFQFGTVRSSIFKSPR